MLASVASTAAWALAKTLRPCAVVYLTTTLLVRCGGRVRQDSDMYLRFSEHEHLDGISNLTVMRLARRVLATSIPLSVFPPMECGLLLISVR